MNEVYIKGQVINGTDKVQVHQSYVADTLIKRNVSLPARVYATLTTRTDASNGVITMPDDSHGYTAGDIFGVFFDGGYIVGCSVDSVSGADITFTAGNGDDLPSASSGLYVSAVTALDLSFVGDNVVYLCLGSSADGAAAFYTDAPAFHDRYVLNGFYPMTYASDSNFTNPVSGQTIDKIELYNNGVDMEAEVQLFVLYNS